LGGAGAVTDDLVYIYDPHENAWNAGQSLPGEKMKLGAAVLGGRIYTFLGKNGVVPSYTVDMYDPPAVGSWASRTPLSSGRGRGCAATVNGRIYLISGDTATMTATTEYRPDTDAYTAMAAMPTPRLAACCAAVGGKIYVFGGTADNYTTFLTTVEEFDPSTGWTSGLAAMPTARADLACAVLQDKIYVVGGQNVASNTLGTLEVYDPAQNAWTTGLQPMTTTRRRLTAAALNGKLFVLGGNESIGTPSTKLEIYDPVADAWSAGPDIPVRRQDPGACALNGQIYVFGGRNYDGILSSVDAFHPHSNTWQAQKDLITGRYALACSVADGRVYALGGGQLAATNTENEEYDDPREDYFTAVHGMLMPRSGAAMASIDDTLYLMGGHTGGANASVEVWTKQYTEDIPSDENTGFTLQSDWTTGTDLSAASKYAGAVEYSSMIYVVGGLDLSGNPMSNFLSFDPMVGSWWTESPMPTARGAAGAVRVGDRLYVFGGDTGGLTITDVTQVYDFLSSSWLTGFANMTLRRRNFG
jgi:N-acetylneuraminic acid mutarotase